MANNELSPFFKKGVQRDIPLAGAPGPALSAVERGLKRGHGFPLSRE